MTSLLSVENDTAGLICGFRLAPLERGGSELLATAEVAAPVWLHFNLTDSRARRWLDEHPQIPEHAKDVLLAADSRIHAQAVAGGLIAVLGDLHHDFDSDPEGFGELRVFVSRAFIITARRHPLMSADRVRRELLRGDAPEDGSPVEVFERLVEALAEAFGDTIGRVSDQVDLAEDEILGGILNEHAQKLGGVRRLLARLRRHVNANRAALGPLPGRLHEWLGTEHSRSLRQVVERLEAVAQDLELVQERARLLQEEIAARLSEATNRNLFVLSMVTVALLPITLITGIFGMNVGGLPWLEHPRGFWHVTVLMLAGVSGAMTYMIRKKVFR